MSDNSLTRSARSRKFCEGWLEHKAHRPTGYRYEKLYALLEDNVIYIFSTDSPSQETQIGNLTLDSNVEYISRGGNASKGFKFDLNTGKRLNRFKTKKSTERELWRGYITGIAKGYVPKDLDLLDSEITTIKRDIDAFHAGEVCDYDPKRTSISSGRSMQSKIDSGVVSLSGQSRFSNNSSSDDTRSRTSESAVSSVSGTLAHGGPTMVHKFYNDHNREQEPPSWFVPHCSRETAEKLLERAVEMNYGNTLMRESTSHLSNGSYVISKLSINKRDDSYEYEHFEVIRTAGGYKVNVQNPHEPMKCLTDVMGYFVKTSGSNTRPLVVNDLKELGQETPGYATQIYTRSPEPWKWPPSDSRDEPEPDYDNQASFTRQNSYKGIEGSQTVTAGILRNRPLPSPGGNERKSDQIQKFDTMLSGFETGFQRDTVYVNQSPSLQEVTPCPAPPPPPPVPHVTERPRSYVNVNTNAVSSPTSTNSRNSLSKSSSFGVKVSTSSPTTSFQLRHSVSSSGFGVSNTTSTRQNVTQSLTENQLRNVKSPDSPKNFPAWNSPKQNEIVPKQANKPDKSNSARDVASDKTGEPEAGIDDKTPGGVSTLRSRFESSSNASSSSSKQGRARSSLPVRWSISTAVSQTLEELDDLYEYLSEDGVQVTNNHISPTNNTNKPVKHSQSLTETNHESMLAVGSTHSLKNMPSQTRTPEMTYDDRQRLEDSIYDDTAVPQEHRTGFNPEFKRKLEGMIGPATVGPAASKGHKQGVPTVHQNSAGAEDHIYQELPEVIPPDDVFYVNERYNVNKSNT